MNNKILLAVVAVIVIAAGLWYFLMPAQTPGTGETATTTSDGTTATGPSVYKGSLAELLKKGGSLCCTFSQASDAATTNGTMYLTKGKMHGDFISQVQAVGKSIETHIINDGVYTYTWSSLSPTGQKMLASAAPTTGGVKGTTTVATNSSVDLSQSLEYNCDSWKGDDSFFTPPANIKFVSA